MDALVKGISSQVKIQQSFIQKLQLLNHMEGLLDPVCTPHMNMDDTSELALHKDEVKISRLWVLPSCPFDVIWSQNICRSIQASLREVQSPSGLSCCNSFFTPLQRSKFHWCHGGGMFSVVRPISCTSSSFIVSFLCVTVTFEFDGMLKPQSSQEEEPLTHEQRCWQHRFPSTV